MNKAIKLSAWIFLILCILISIFPVVSSAPSVTSITTQSGSLEILAPTFENALKAEDMDFYWHVFNTSALLTNKAVSCYYHLYSQQNKGQHIYVENDVKQSNNGRDFEAEIKGANFTVPGSYCHLIECNSSTQTGGIERCFVVTYTGKVLTGSQASIYIFLLLFFLMITFGSFKLIKEHSIAQDKINYSSLYQDKKRSEIMFYLKLIKNKFWIVGVFGIYLSLVCFAVVASQMLSDFELNELTTFALNITQVLLWGLIPFVIFWIIYLILFFYKSLAETLKYQFGGFRRER